MNYKTMKIEDIIAWCKANNQVEWLKAKVAEETTYKVYPRVKIIDSNGKAKMVSDKNAKPKTEKRPISFIQIKREFVMMFMPEIAPKAKEKKPSMYDVIANL